MQGLKGGEVKGGWRRGQWVACRLEERRERREKAQTNHGEEEYGRSVNEVSISDCEASRYTYLVMPLLHF